MTSAIIPGKNVGKVQDVRKPPPDLKTKRAFSGVCDRLALQAKPTDKGAKMATDLTAYEVTAILDQYDRLVDIDPESGRMRNRLLYTEDRVTVFTSEAWTTNFTERERAEVVQRFLTMVAHHQVSESLHEWSPAHVGYTVRTYRAMKSPYLNAKAEQIDRWARKTLGERALPVYTNATK